MALILHAVRKMRKIPTPALSVEGRRLRIPAAMHHEGRDYLVAAAQEEVYPTDFLRLRSGEKVLQTSGLAHSRPSFNESRGFIETLPRYATHARRKPLLPAQGQLFKLVVLDAHLSVFHGGPQTTRAAVLKSYDTVRAYGRIKRILRNCCGPCLRNSGTPFRTVEPRLPDWRTDPNAAFQIVGMDHLGPLRIGSDKRYVLLTTCAVTRGIHLELQESLSALDTSRAMRRVFARRGTPRMVVSDNHPSFLALKELVDEWKTTPPHAPWMGGFYERLVGVVKRSLRATLGLTHVSHDELQTVLAEVESAINARPLVATPEGSDEPLTPAHFLQGASPARDGVRVEPVPGLERAWRHRAKLADDAWRRFTEEYLPTLRQWRTPEGGQPDPPREGELVLVAASPLPRLRWPLAKVVRVHDHHCDVKMRNIITSRPTKHLYRLEAAPTDVVTPRDPTASSDVLIPRDPTTPTDDVTPRDPTAPTDVVMTRAGRRSRPPTRFEAS
jgi:hypothetical protein